jgi:hypothetical protein
MVETANQLAIYDAKAYLAWMELENPKSQAANAGNWSFARLLGHDLGDWLVGVV